MALGGCVSDALEEHSGGGASCGRLLGPVLGLDY